MANSNRIGEIMTRLLPDYVVDQFLISKRLLVWSGLLIFIALCGFTFDHYLRQGMPSHIFWDVAFLSASVLVVTVSLQRCADVWSGVMLLASTIFMVAALGRLLGHPTTDIAAPLVVLYMVGLQVVWLPAIGFMLVAQRAYLARDGVWWGVGWVCGASYSVAVITGFVYL